MADAPRLYVVTDDPAQAALQLLGLRLFDMPDWIRMVTEAREIERLADGCRAIGFWFHGQSAASIAWDERRSSGGFGITAAFMAQLDAWLEKRKAHEAQIIADAIAAEKAAGTYDPFIPSQSAA